MQMGMLVEGVGVYVGAKGWEDLRQDGGRKI
jgi:hypothetical protein